ncbi:unnamed protein product [Polarella glacialis]|uniref:Uncharacterized protein n=1 Tax=Polarella glacialis TaxID=89957 RepID=A0A813DLE2_POLGL|nr:unnamed protein product [Polarella glacialis]
MGCAASVHPITSAEFSQLVLPHHKRNVELLGLQQVKTTDHHQQEQQEQQQQEQQEQQQEQQQQQQPQQRPPRGRVPVEARQGEVCDEGEVAGRACSFEQAIHGRCREAEKEFMERTRAELMRGMLPVESELIASLTFKSAYFIPTSEDKGPLPPGANNDRHHCKSLAAMMDRARAMPLSIVEMVQARRGQLTGELIGGDWS